MMESRLTELEIKIAFHEDLLQALNTIVASQQQLIDRLEKSHRLLHERLSSLDFEKPSQPMDEIPPHY